MNKNFMIHTVTIYHMNDDDSITRMVFNDVYFRHNKKTNMFDKRP